MLQFESVSHRYSARGEWVLNNVNFELLGGESLLITGRSGGGKTTLLMIAAGLLRPTQGKANLFHKSDIYELGRVARTKLRQSLIGLMVPDFSFVPYLTVRKNIELACPKSHPSNNLEKLLSQTSIAGCANRYPSQLSTGELRRAMFCRAIICNPKLLLVDEPCANLDAGASQDLWSLIRTICDENPQMTTVVVSHTAPTCWTPSRTLELVADCVVSTN